MDYQLKINGVVMPPPKREGITVKKEKIWSSNTGRSASGKMLGTLVAIKRTVSIQWPTLTAAQATVIDRAVSDKDHPFVPMQYTDITGQTVTMDVYFSTPTFTVRSTANGVKIVGASVDGIEQ